MTITLPSVRAAAMSRGYLVAFDPGVDHPAAAVFLDGELRAASRVRVPGAIDSLEVGERCRQIALLVREWVMTQTGGVKPSNFVYELMQILRVGKSKGDPNKLVPLVALAGNVSGYLDAPALAYQPGEWSGGIKKSTKAGEAWTSPRGKLIWRLLRETERPRVESTHDAVDSVGIGMKALGRLGKTFPGTV